MDRISDNVASLVQYEKYGTIDTSDTSTNEFYVIMFTPEAYTTWFKTIWFLEADAQ